MHHIQGFGAQCPVCRLFHVWLAIPAFAFRYLSPDLAARPPLPLKRHAAPHGNLCSVTLLFLPPLLLLLTRLVWEQESELDKMRNELEVQHVAMDRLTSYVHSVEGKLTKMKEELALEKEKRQRLEEQLQPSTR